ncbi:MAG TPA: type IV pilus modification protein PilV [Gammaproteobacteria bacterium]|nr:type IV pilus modification protein PilV [Gammaproteobacteria bacterium]
MSSVPWRQSGFTLFEVLIAVLILSIGLLGIAGLQTASLKSNHSAYQRSQAALLAYDMIDRMRANQTGVAAGAYNDLDGSSSDPGCISSGCSAAAMAQYDDYQWGTAISQLLPAGKGKVSGAGTGSVFTVTVMWDDDQTGATGEDCSGASGDLKCLSVSTQL